MKNTFAAVMVTLFVMQTVFTAPVYASSIFSVASSVPHSSDNNAQLKFDLRPLDVTSQEGGFDVFGEIPLISGLDDEDFQNALNEQFFALKEEKKASVEKTAARSMSFSFSTKTGYDDNIVSILIYSSASGGLANHDVTSFNFNAATCQMIDITDVLGVNAIALVDRFISDTIKQNPDRFNPEFKGVNDSLNFAVDGGHCLILFNKYEIAPGYEDIVQFTIKTSDVRNVVVPRREYKVLENDYNLKMIPMRAVCEGLGYSVMWDATSHFIIISKGSFTSKIMIGKNIYTSGANSPRELEAPPQIIDGKTYLPISFFEAILTATYTIDGNENITFSQYRLK